MRPHPRASAGAGRASRRPNGWPRPYDVAVALAAATDVSAAGCSPVQLEPGSRRRSLRRWRLWLFDDPIVRHPRSRPAPPPFRRRRRPSPLRAVQALGQACCVPAVAAPSCRPPLASPCALRLRPDLPVPVTADSGWAGISRPRAASSIAPNETLTLEPGTGVRLPRFAARRTSRRLTRIVGMGWRQAAKTYYLASRKDYEVFRRPPDIGQIRPAGTCSCRCGDRENVDARGRSQRRRRHQSCSGRRGVVGPRRCRPGCSRPAPGRRQPRDLELTRYAVLDRLAGPYAFTLLVVPPRSPRVRGPPFGCCLLFRRWARRGDPHAAGS